MKLFYICEQAVVETEVGSHTLPYTNGKHAQSEEERDWFITGDEDKDDSLDVEKTVRNHGQDINSLKHSTKVGFSNVGNILQKILDRLDSLETKFT